MNEYVFANSCNSLAKNHLGKLFFATVRLHYVKCLSPGGGMADTGDLKSPDRKVVRVRLPPRVPAIVKDLRYIIVGLFFWSTPGKHTFPNGRKAT